MSDWLAAYEAQKAKALKKIEEQGSSKSGSGGTSSDRGALAGSTSFQGLVDAKEVRHLTRSTQITKIMDTMKTKAPPKPPTPTASLSSAMPPKPAVPKPTPPPLLPSSRQGLFLGTYLAVFWATTTTPHLDNVTDDHRYSPLLADFLTVGVGIMLTVCFLETRSL